MKRLLLASLIALAATGANAQSNASTACTNPDIELFHNPTPENEKQRLEFLKQYSNISDAERPDALNKISSLQSCEEIEARIVEVAAVFEKSWTQLELGRTLEAQDEANNDLINGIRMRLDSQNQAQILDGINALKNHLAIAEINLSGQNNCSGYTVGGLNSHTKICNPIPAFQTYITSQFNQKNWPILATPSASIASLADLYKNGTDDTKNEVVNFLSGLTYDVASMRILPSIELFNAQKLMAETTTARRQEIQEKREHEGSVIGNFGSIHERILPAIGNWIGMLFALFILSGFLMSPISNFILFFIPPESRRKIAQTVMANASHIMIAFIPVQALYILFGGLLSRYMSGGFSKILFLAAFIPLVVLVKKTWPNATIIPPALLAFFKNGTSKAKTNVVAGDAVHGSAQWSNGVTAVENGRVLVSGRVLDDSYGFALGRITDEIPPQYDVDTRLRYMGHVLTVAPSGSGKGVGAVTPTLLEYPGSTIVLDPKGELYATTSRYRRDELGHKIVVCDPFGALKSLGYDVEGSRLNWLDYIDVNSPDVVNQSALLADLIVVAEGRSSDSSAHFNETAKTFLRGLLVHVASLPEGQRSMGRVRHLLTADADDFDELLIEMQTNESGQGLVQRAVNSLLATPEKERGSILSTVRRHTDFLDDKRITDALAVSDFDLNKLKKEKMTVYIVMPPDRIEINKRFLRVMFGLAVNGVTTVAGKPDYRVLFLFDEFAQLGHMNVVEKALPIIRGFGGVFWFILQNIGQLKSNYSDNWQSFVANSGAKQFFGTSDHETAKYISETLGKTTVEFNTSNQNSGSSMGMQMSTNSGSGQSQQFTGRDLLTPDEILKLPADKVIVMTSGKGEAPYLLDRITYYKDAAYDGRHDPNPYES